MSTGDLEELRKDLADSVAVASAAITQIKTLLAARDSGYEVVRLWLLRAIRVVGV